MFMLSKEEVRRNVGLRRDQFDFWEMFSAYARLLGISPQSACRKLSRLTPAPSSCNGDDRRYGRRCYYEDVQRRAGSHIVSVLWTSHLQACLVQSSWAYMQRAWIGTYERANTDVEGGRRRDKSSYQTDQTQQTMNRAASSSWENDGGTRFWNRLISRGGISWGRSRQRSEDLKKN